MSFQGSVPSWFFVAEMTIHFFQMRSPRCRAGVEGDWGLTAMGWLGQGSHCLWVCPHRTHRTPGNEPSKDGGGYEHAPRLGLWS